MKGDPVVHYHCPRCYQHRRDRRRPHRRPKLPPVPGIRGLAFLCSACGVGLLMPPGQPARLLLPSEWQLLQAHNLEARLLAICEATHRRRGRWG